MRGTKRVLYRRCGAIFEPGSYTSSSVAGGALRAGASAADTHLRSQRFAPLIYGEPICKLHCSLHEGISACPTRDSSTLTCGLMLPTYRILVTTISSQSRQENPVSEQDTAKEPQTSSTPITDSPPPNYPKIMSILLPILPPLPRHPLPAQQKTPPAQQKTPRLPTLAFSG